MDFIISMIYLIDAIIGITLVICLFVLCRNVAKIKNMLTDIRWLKETSSCATTPEISGVNDTKVRDYCKALSKGDTVLLLNYGFCTFYGKWEGKYCFYPKKIDNLPDSPFLVRDVEPYLAVPESELVKFVII